MTKCSFSIGDLVAVSGMKETREGYKFGQATLSEVLVVGKYDLFLINIKEKGYSYPTIFRASKEMCVRISGIKDRSHVQIVLPKIGDLVISYTKRKTNAEQIIGVLEEIDHTPSKPKMGKVRSGTQIHTIFYDDLIVAER